MQVKRIPVLRIAARGIGLLVATRATFPAER